MSEYDEQVLVFGRAEMLIARNNRPWHNQLRTLHASLNGMTAPASVNRAGKRYSVVAGKQRRAGLKRGVPDLFWPVASGEYNGLFIELKALQGSPSEEQLLWLSRLTGNGYLCCICYTADVVIEPDLQNSLFERYCDHPDSFGPGSVIHRLRPGRAEELIQPVPDPGWKLWDMTIVTSRT